VSYVFAKSASNYEIPRESCIYIIENYEGFGVGFSRELRDKLAWVGLDQAGNYIEIVAIDFIYYWYVIHAKPASNQEGFDEIKKRLK
jgi:hypothetical protein